MTNQPPSRLGFYFFIFALSGGAGLIYESIWTHYLKLFLGHAAYAQTLVLAIFMGGMAIGSALAARFSHRVGNTLAAYAIVEALIGIAALVFHPLYTTSVQYAYDSLFPSMTSSTILTVKWSLAALLILPQSILLGATFPFMSSGILRRFPTMPGRSLSFLYFNNSFGAAIGVLLSGYLFIPRLGLPGTMQVAGTLNLVLAGAVWFLSQADGRSASDATLLNPVNKDTRAKATLILMITIAAFTGAASFMYEIAWIRMLSMVLGSTTHAFELMLSAFIFGLAIGGFTVRRFIDQLISPLKTLALIQLAMGVLAATTLYIYGSAFQIMGFTVNNLASTVANYTWFNIICHGIALLVMLPATICAGMTLPLITFQLLKRNQGESAIGNVYAGNTLGAIVGIVLSIQWILPSFGLKTLILAGAGIDIVLGLVILSGLLSAKRISLARFAMPTTPALVSFILLAVFVHLDPLAMASGIYTTGEIKRNREMIYLRDGKTASISFFRNDDYLAIATNGKTEAAISSEELAKDEPTMILLGLLPLAIKTDARNVATIGIGSGLTTHSLLQSPTLKQVDTIEIEPAMVEAARLFGDRVKATFTDPRSHIYIEDAKAFFTNQGSRYDLIISEPSNPWISGVAGLFSQEFYRHVRRYLHDDGLLVQWIHLYHIDLPQIASVVKALSPQFEDYQIYALNLSDIAIVASKRGPVPPLQAFPFIQAPVAQQLARVGVESVDDFAIRQLGNKAQLEAFFNSFAAPTHSDFAPYLDYSASRSRFLRASATPLLELGNIPKAYFNFIGFKGKQAPKQIGPNFHLPLTDSAKVSAAISNDLPDNLNVVCQNREQALGWMRAIHQYADQILPYYADGETNQHWQQLSNGNCLSYLSDISRRWIQLYQAMATSDAENAIKTARQLMPEIHPPQNIGEEFLYATMITAYARLGDTANVRSLLEGLDSSDNLSVLLRFAVASVERNIPG